GPRPRRAAVPPPPSRRSAAGSAFFLLPVAVRALDLAAADHRAHVHLAPGVAHRGKLTLLALRHVAHLQLLPDLEAIAVGALDDAVALGGVDLALGAVGGDDDRALERLADAALAQELVEDGGRVAIAFIRGELGPALGRLDLAAG